VHGPSGVGKSRLLAGLVAEWLRRQPGSSIAHLDAEAFLACCLEAAAGAGGAGWSALRGRFRSVDLFVLEDLEGLERGPLAREELVHTVDALAARGAAMVFSANSAPVTWAGDIWPHRLVNRLLAGLVIRLTPPGLASRRRYILQNARQHNFSLAAEALEMLATAADGYRTLDGWISRLALEIRLKHKPPARETAHAFSRRAPQPLAHHPALPFLLDRPSVATILAEETLLAGLRVTIDVISRQTARQFAVRLGTLRGPSRHPSIVIARHIAMYLARAHTQMSFSEIGMYFSGRDPATVRHACKKTAMRLHADPALAAVVTSLAAPWIRTDL
jgi:chromosomal replication initiator protein